jgi:hypothetical protein
MVIRFFTFDIYRSTNCLNKLYTSSLEIIFKISRVKFTDNVDKENKM